jgi:membrane protein
MRPDIGLESEMLSTRSMRFVWRLLKEAASDWNRHEAQTRGAALAYYSILSMAPLIVISIAIAGFVFGREAAQGQIVYQIRTMVGDAGAKVIQDVLKSASHPSQGVLATAIGVLTLLIGASAVFSELRNSLNRIFEAPKDTQHSGLAGTFRFYIVSITMVLTIGFLLLVSLLLTTFLELFEHWVTGVTPIPLEMARAFNVVLSFVVVTVLFALIYKFVPDVRVNWNDVWFGALATAALFTLGKYLLALYIAKAGVGSAYGAAGSLVILLFWVYYSAQIFFFGAEITHILVEYRRSGRPVA